MYPRDVAPLIQLFTKLSFLTNPHKMRVLPLHPVWLFSKQLPMGVSFTLILLTDDERPTHYREALLSSLVATIERFDCYATSRRFLLEAAFTDALPRNRWYIHSHASFHMPPCSLDSDM